MNTPRAYDATDIKVLMANTGAWARNWDDVLRYLEGPARKDSVFSDGELPQLIEDVKHLKEEHARFTTDYRAVWQELSMHGASHPAPVSDASRGPSSRVLDVLQRVESKEYREMARLLDASRDDGWRSRN